MSAKKIVFLTEPLTSPSTRFRVLQNIPEFTKLNLDIACKVIPKGISDRLRLFASLPSYDIVILQRKLFQWGVLWYIRKKSKKLIYDFDDAVLYRDSNASTFHSTSRLRRFRHSLKFADLAIAGNNYLKNISLRFTKNVVVIPTGINTETYTPNPQTRVPSPVTIGWIGSAPNLFYLKQLIEPINSLYKINNKFRLKIVCDDFIDGFHCPVENKKWQKDDEIKDIQSFDVGILPMTDDKWTKGKCALKLLQYMSCGLTSISSTSEVTSTIIQDGYNGFLASSVTDWIEKLNIAIENPVKRGNMGKEARISIMKKYDSQTIVLKYLNVFNHIYNEKI